MLETVVFFTIALLIEYNFFFKRKTLKIPQSENQKLLEPDVQAEMDRTYSPKNTDILKVSSLAKVFQQKGSSKHLVAVNRIALSVPNGECFGLLGINGAGKTTTFKMLTTELIPSEGDATISELSIVSDVNTVKRRDLYLKKIE